MNILYCIIPFVIGFLIGFFVTYVILKKKKEDYSGVLNIITSDPDGPYMFLEVENSIDSFVQLPKVVFKVSHD